MTDVSKTSRGLGRVFANLGTGLALFAASTCLSGCGGGAVAGAAVGAAVGAAIGSEYDDHHHDECDPYYDDCYYYKAGAPELDAPR